MLPEKSNYKICIEPLQPLFPFANLLRLSNGCKPCSGFATVGDSSSRVEHGSTKSRDKRENFTELTVSYYVPMRSSRLISVSAWRTRREQGSLSFPLVLSCPFPLSLLFFFLLRLSFFISFLVVPTFTSTFFFILLHTLRSVYEPTILGLRCTRIRTLYFSFGCCTRFLGTISSSECRTGHCIYMGETFWRDI